MFTKETQRKEGTSERRVERNKEKRKEIMNERGSERQWARKKIKET